VKNPGCEMLVRVIPVIDLKDGMVVHGVAGERSQYQPIRSVLASNPRPGTVARAFSNTGVFREVYVADLAAIAGRQPDWAALREIADSGLRIWLDAGVADADRFQELMAYVQHHNGLEAIILGSESLDEEIVLRTASTELGASRCVFSLDLRDGRPVVRQREWLDQTPIQIASTVFALGVRRMILLDLATVGTRRGPQSLELARRLRAEHPTLQLIGGGGIRGLDDLHTLAASGFSGALVATALHSGAIRPEDLAACLPESTLQRVGTGGTRTPHAEA
jgi:phosphoribosylformimino-5-aminoimidazole carboxamide ribotide isomerase